MLRNSTDGFAYFSDVVIHKGCYLFAERSRTAAERSEVGWSDLFDVIWFILSDPRIPEELSASRCIQ